MTTVDLGHPHGARAGLLRPPIGQPATAPAAPPGHLRPPQWTTSAKACS